MQSPRFNNLALFSIDKEIFEKLLNDKIPVLEIFENKNNGRK